MLSLLAAWVVLTGEVPRFLGTDRVEVPDVDAFVGDAASNVTSICSIRSSGVFFNLAAS